MTRQKHDLLRTQHCRKVAPYANLNHTCSPLVLRYTPSTIVTSTSRFDALQVEVRVGVPARSLDKTRTLTCSWHTSCRKGTNDAPQAPSPECVFSMILMFPRIGENKSRARHSSVYKTRVHVWPMSVSLGRSTRQLLWCVNLLSRSL